MQSKIVVNIFALGALAGLTTFGMLAIVDLEHAKLDKKRILDHNKMVIENSKTSAQTIELQANLIELTKKNEILQKTVTDYRMERDTLGEVLLDLENKKALVITDLEELEAKRINLNNSLIELREDLKKETNLKAVKVEVQKERINTDHKILSELNKLEEKNKILEKENIILQNQNRQSLLELNAKLRESEDKFKQAKNEFKAKENVLEKDQNALKQRITALMIESQKKSQRIASQKETHLNQLAQKKAELLSIIKSNKELQGLKNLKSNFEKLNGLRVIFSGNMIYDEAKSQIVFRAENSIGIPIFQDDFTGSIAGKCGLPIDKKIENRCSATIIAEFVVENQGLFLRGKEIVEIVRK